ncbi:MAG: catalase family peroxidase [Hyphomicrobiaceae bacterium]|nr:catalase family peroxidase [Hyphomicrobiaceae bacterium]
MTLARVLLVATACAMPLHRAAAQDVEPEQVVNALEGTFGVHPGQRRNHIKGTCAAGEFVGTAEAAAISRSALFAGAPVPVVARFSLPSGNPKIPDTAKTVRGMALQFRLPGNDLQHMTMLNTPVFGAAHPRTFHAGVVAQKPDAATGRPDPERLKAFRAGHPDTDAQARFLASQNPPPSYANSAFFGIHTFKFVDAARKKTPVRWRFVPQAGEKALADAELTSLPPDFLESRLIEATKAGPVRWDMIVSIGEPGDPEIDPTKEWPKERREIKAGTLSITSASPQKGAACEPINFDPLVMAAGIEASEDPILLFRSPSYAYSFSRRTEGK